MLEKQLEELTLPTAPPYGERAEADSNEEEKQQLQERGK